MSDVQSPAQTSTVNVVSTVEEGTVENASRYTFQLTSIAGVTRTFIVDVPHVESDSTDVWVSDSTVMVGDTPADGFATFTPVSTD